MKTNKRFRTRVVKPEKTPIQLKFPLKSKSSSKHLQRPISKIVWINPEKWPETGVF